MMTSLPALPTALITWVMRLSLRVFVYTTDIFLLLI
jgi:hypothetical protein